MKRKINNMIKFKLMKIKEIVNMKTKTKEVITTSRMTSKEMKMEVKLDREVAAEVVEVEEVVRMVIIKRRNSIMMKDLSIKTKKSTKRNNLTDKCLMIQITKKRKKKRKMDRETPTKEREVDNKCSTSLKAKEEKKERVQITKRVEEEVMIKEDQERVTTISSKKVGTSSNTKRRSRLITTTNQKTQLTNSLLLFPKLKVTLTNKLQVNYRSSHQTDSPLWMMTFD